MERRTQRLPLPLQGHAARLPPPAPQPVTSLPGERQGGHEGSPAGRPARCPYAPGHGRWRHPEVTKVTAPILATAFQDVSAGRNRSCPSAAHVPRSRLTQAQVHAQAGVPSVCRRFPETWRRLPPARGPFPTTRRVSVLLQSRQQQRRARRPRAADDAAAGLSAAAGGRHPRAPDGAEQADVALSTPADQGSSLSLIHI